MGSTNDSSMAPPTPDGEAAQNSASTIVQHLESAGKAELEAIKPKIAEVVRAYVKQYEAEHMKGIVGLVERRIIDAVVDGIFGPAPE